MTHQECCFAIQKQHSFIFTRGLRKPLELPLKITNRKLKRILEEDCKKFINRQSSRKAVTQSYRAFDMAASCTLYNKSAGDTVDIFIYSVFYMFEDIKKVFDIDKKSMNKE